MTIKDVLTTHDLSQILHINISTVIDWIDQGRLPAYRTPGGHRRVRKSDFLLFLRDYKMPLPAGSPQETRTVLLVEDDDGFRRALRRFIQEDGGGVRIEEAVDGFTAGQQVEALKPDVIVLDLTLPGIDGFRVCAQVRARPDLAATRILAISADGSEERRRRILEAGADGFLAKPFGRADLAAALNRLRSAPAGKAEEAGAVRVSGGGNVFRVNGDRGRHAR